MTKYRMCADCLIHWLDVPEVGAVVTIVMPGPECEVCAAERAGA